MPNHLAEDLITHGFELARLDPRRPKQVNLRRATSAAYYGVFHALADEIGRPFRPQARPSANRLLNHATAKQAANKIAGSGTLHTMVGGSVCPTGLKQVALDFVALQSFRHLADYSVASTFERKTVLEHLQRANRAVATVRQARTACPAELHGFLLALLGARDPL